VLRAMPLWLALVIAHLAVACVDGAGDAGASDDAGVDPSSFIALQRDFQGFLEWERVFAGVGQLSSTDGHGETERYVHLKERPAPDDTAFPVGSILVKTHEDATRPKTEWTIFAMVKRAETYNADGAQGWEWFELALDDDEAAIIVWRGTKPPDGHNYGCLTGTCVERGSCNVCHVSEDNDHVLTPELDYSAQFANSLLDGGVP
jgi:hypothetical protein